MSWRDQLLPAAFRGVPFVHLATDAQFGRRQALHEYAWRDTPWSEDMGRAARHIEVRGFLIGDDVIAQRERMIAAAERDGPALLVHSTYGTLEVALLSPLRVHERWDEGRYFEIHFSCLESGKRIFPQALIATGNDTAKFADAADLAANGDFVAKAAAALGQGAAITRQALGTAAFWARRAQSAGDDATSLTHLVATLPGNYGRYTRGGQGGFSGVLNSITATDATVTSLIAQGARARGALHAAAAGFTNTAGDLGAF